MRWILAEHDSCLLRLPAAWLICLAVCLTLSPALPGCGGCRQDDAKTKAEQEAERLAKERERKMADFEIASPVSEPCDGKELVCRYKPGHWASVVVGAKANKEDFAGELELSVHEAKESESVALEAVPYRMVESREVALSEGHEKSLHGSFFAPATDAVLAGRFRLIPRDIGGSLDQPFPLARMLAYQYHFAVLAGLPNRYGFLRSLDSIKPPGNDGLDPGNDYDYWVSLLEVDRQTALPARSLFWTSIAYLLWDDVEPNSLSPDQQRALIDWLHWGGQLILSGPDTLDALRGSFLADYLPAEAAGTWELKSADFDELNRRFTLAGQRPLAPKGPWSAVRLRPAADAQFVLGTGRLLVEGRVGLGRIVVSALRLSDRTLIDWPGFDGWFNACLLRRPARSYKRGDFDNIELGWADTTFSPRDAALTCKLRYFARDAGMTPPEYMSCAFSNEVEEDGVGDASSLAGSLGTSNPSTSMSKQTASDGPGVAAWRSFSPAADRARAALRNAACVEVPNRWFVIWVVAVYLIVLVPLNWLVFNALGRVEWAWAAAPVIAIACTVVVVHAARLNIGFARSETSVGVLEIQSRHSRAHLARFAALYTSLTTQYTFSQDDPGALIQPFPKVGRRGQFRLSAGERVAELDYRHGKGVELAGFSVPSNSVDFIHAEQMIEMDGPLEMTPSSRGSWQLVNQTGVALHGVGVIRRNEKGRIETAWVGELKPYGSDTLTLVARSETEGPWFLDRREADACTQASAVKGKINLRGLIDLAEDVQTLRAGESRLVGWTDEALGGLKISPAAPQSRHAVLVVAHLNRAPYGPPEPDAISKEQLNSHVEPQVLHGP
ncbi:MAG: hypothetical protein JW888_00445 [Pirellulales bacterium]|nr:hypothetical protein [Pirellulales bacterium]